MFDPQMALLSKLLASVVTEVALNPGNHDGWVRARHALESTWEHEPELAAVIEKRDLAALRTMVEGWASGARPLPEQDREVLKRAMKAYRKSLKVTLLDAESSLGGGPMSGGRRSAILGITPPPRYPREVWQELARQGRLIDAKHGIYELPPE